MNIEVAFDTLREVIRPLTTSPQNYKELVVRGFNRRTTHTNRGRAFMVPSFFHETIVKKVTPQDVVVLVDTFFFLRINRLPLGIPV